MATITSLTSASATYVPYASREAARVHALRQQGGSPSEIAAILGIPTGTVDSYLGIPASNAAAVPGAALTAAPAQSSAVPKAISIFA
jgi:hypothetical protein